VVGIGNGAEVVKKTVGEDALFVLQEKRLGTAHAIMCVEELLKDEQGLVLVIAGDMPMLTAATLKALVEKQERNNGPLTMLTVLSDHPRGFGRILRDARGGLPHRGRSAGHRGRVEDQRIERGRVLFCFRLVVAGTKKDKALA
jgi:bifunctional UDP-N-acetylglucosamine pyrophosphorylase/glucosamine-1-phosphate N-acetyltransferase